MYYTLICLCVHRRVLNDFTRLKGHPCCLGDKRVLRSQRCMLPNSSVCLFITLLLPPSFQAGNRVCTPNEQLCDAASDFKTGNRRPTRNC